MKKLVQFLSFGTRKYTATSRKVTVSWSSPKPLQNRPLLSPTFFLKSRHYYITKLPDELIRVVRSEIAYEKSYRKYGEGAHKGLLGPFVLANDPPRSQDVVLRRSYDHEEIAITALLDSTKVNNEAGELEEMDIYPRSVLMKLCITKSGIPSILQFDCRLQGYDNAFIIYHVSYHESPHCLQPSKNRYRGPTFSSLDSDLQDAFKEFLEARGLNANLLNFLIIHLHDKEQQQYVQWLHYLGSIMESA